MNRFARLSAVLAAIMFAGIFSTGCMSDAQYRTLKEKYNRDTNAQEQVIRQLQHRNEDLERMNAALMRERDAALTEVGLVGQETRRLEDYIDTLKGELASKMGTLMDGLGATRNIDGGWEFQNEILFDSGKATIKREGKDILATIASRVKAEKINVIVVGHTDNTPIRRSIKQNPTGMNLQLGARRSVAVCNEFFKSGIAETRLEAVSRGMAKPKADNTSKTGQKANRRVEIYFVEGTNDTVDAPAIPVSSDNTGAPQK